MTLPAGLQPTKHRFVADSLNPAVCVSCGEAEDFGALHPDSEPPILFADLAAPPVWPSADLDADPLPTYGSTTDPDNCECGLLLADAGRGWRTPGCPECRRH